MGLIARKLGVELQWRSLGGLIGIRNATVRRPAYVRGRRTQRTLVPAARESIPSYAGWSSRRLSRRKQIVKFSPWMTEREHLNLPAIHRSGLPSSHRLTRSIEHDRDAQTEVF